MMRKTVFGAIMLVLAAPAQAGFTVPANRPGQFAPRDACLTLPGARSFATALRSAITRRDARALAELAAPDVRLDFGGGSGRAEMARRLAGAEGAELWRALDGAANMGCAAMDNDLVFPWIFAQDLGDVDPFDAFLITGPAVPLYRSASSKGPPRARLNWQLVVTQGDGLAPDAAKRPLRRISVISSPLEGYVPSGSLRSVVDYRLIASPHRGGWQITAFVAGD